MKKIIMVISLTLVTSMSVFAQSKANKQVTATPSATLANVDAQNNVGDRTANSASLTTSGSLNALPVATAQPVPAVKSGGVQDKIDVRKQPSEKGRK